MTEAEVVRAVEDAQEGQRAISSMPSYERAQLLLAVAQQIADARDDLAFLLATENGKPLPQTEGEVDAAIRIFRGYAAEATRIFGRQIPLDAVPGLERNLAITVREPLGVVAAIVPPSTTRSSCTRTRRPPRSPRATP